MSKGWIETTATPSNNSNSDLDGRQREHAFFFGKVYSMIFHSHRYARTESCGCLSFLFSLAFPFRQRFQPEENAEGKSYQNNVPQDRMDQDPVAMVVHKLGSKVRKGLDNLSRGYGRRQKHRPPLTSHTRPSD